MKTRILIAGFALFGIGVAGFFGPSLGQARNCPPYIIGGNSRITGSSLSIDCGGTGGGTSGIGGTGTANYVARFLDATNLVVSQLYDNGTNIGIGTTLPSQKFEVAGAIYSSSGGFKFPDGTTQTTAAVLGSSPWATNGSNIYNTNSGVVGIGTSSPQAMLHIRQIAAYSPTVRITDTNNEDTEIGRVNFGWNGLTNPFIIQNISGSGTNDFVFTPTTNSPASGLVIKGSGNVGIGTISPSQRLDVAGNLRVRSLTNCNTIDTDANGNLVCGTDETGTTGAVAWSQLTNFPAGCPAGQFVTGVGSALSCATPPSGTIGGSGTANYVPKFLGTTNVGNSQIVDDGTFVGIGTSTPTQKLDVAGMVSAAWGYKFPDGTVQVTAATTPPNYWSTNGSFLYNNTGGNVGIGTSTPQAKLDVNGDIQIPTGKRIGLTGNLNSEIITYGDQAPFNTPGMLFTAHPSRGFIFGNYDGTTWTEQMRISGGTGNMGLGTTNPQSRLQVSNGYIQVPFPVSSPSTADCDNNSEGGRMAVWANGTYSYLYICRGSMGWSQIPLN